jgi:hypothetical protein
VAKAPTSLSIDVVKRHGHPTRVVVTLAYPAGISATGLVRISDGNGHRCKKAVKGNKVTCTIPPGTGSVRLRAHYAGDPDHTSARARRKG